MNQSDDYLVISHLIRKSQEKLRFRVETGASLREIQETVTRIEELEVLLQQKQALQRAFMRKGALALALPFVALLDVEFAYLFLYKQASAPYFWRGILIVLGMRSLLVIGTWWRGPRWLLGTAVRISVALPLSPFVAVRLGWTTRGLLGPIFGDLLWSYIGPVVWFMIVLAAILWWPLVRSLE